MEEGYDDNLWFASTCGNWYNLKIMIEIIYELTFFMY